MKAKKEIPIKYADIIYKCGCLLFTCLYCISIYSGKCLILDKEKKKEIKMKIFNLRTVEKETRIYYYRVRAKSLEHAKEQVENHEVEMFDYKFIEGEIESIREAK